MRIRRFNRAKNQRGQELIEVVAGMIFLIPVLLAMLDLAVYVLGQQMADKYTKAAARAAANQGTSAAASTAAQNALNNFGKSGFITSMTLDSINYIPINANDTTTGRVEVQVVTQLNLPVPAPFLPASFSTPTLTTKSIETVVAMPP